MASSDLEDYPLHRAVYENSISDLIELLYNGGNGNRFYIGLEDCDMLGNTPLLLAVKIQNIEAIAVLLEYCADPSNKPSHRCTLFLKVYRIAFDPIGEAVILQDREILRLLLKAEYRRRQNQFAKCRIVLSGVLSGLADFSMNLSWNCAESVVPLVGGFIQPEYYRVNNSIQYNRYIRARIACVLTCTIMALIIRTLVFCIKVIDEVRSRRE